MDISTHTQVKVAQKVKTTPLVSVYIHLLLAGVFFIAGALHAFSVLVADTAISNDKAPDNGASHSFFLNEEKDFDRLESISSNLNDHLFGVARRGSFVRVLVPRLNKAREYCAQKYSCPQRVMYYSGDLLSVVRDLYSEDFGSLTDEDWRRLTEDTQTQVYYDCFVQKLRQGDGAYGFDCMQNMSDRLFTQAEVTDMYQKIFASFGLGTLVYAPDGISNYSRQVEAQGWNQTIFSIFNETLWLNSIENYEQLNWLTGYDLSIIPPHSRPLLFIAPLPDTASYCAQHERSGVACLKKTVFGSGIFYHHEQYFSLVSPKQAQAESLFDLERSGYYQRGVIWKEAGGVYKFTINFRNYPHQQTPEFIQSVYDEIQKNFGAGVLYFVPSAQLFEIAKTWPKESIHFPIALEDEISIDYEPYYNAETIGQIRVVTLAKLQSMIDDGTMNWRIIPVLTDQLPDDIEVPIAGIITSIRQSPAASHLSLRMIRRGAPNAYMSDISPLRLLEGKNVKLKVDTLGYTVKEVALAEAEAWWQAHAKRLSPPRALDRTFSEFTRYKDMNEEGQTALVSRFGGKAAGLGRLNQIIPIENQIDGFGIPFKYFLDFVKTNTIIDLVALSEYSEGNGPSPKNISIYEAYHRLLEWDPFREDAEVRKIMLDNIRNIIESSSAKINPDFHANLYNRIKELFGEKARVRFRSSSNTEDTLEFNGAGLYESKTVCLEDEISGKGICNNDKKPDNIERGLKRVWSSLFGYKAFEERLYYDLPQTLDRIGMAIAVTSGFPDEEANAVIFTGDPTSQQQDSFYRDYVINIQPGEESVVSPDPDVHSEMDIIRISDEGTVLDIIRARNSSLLPDGSYVLGDSDLEGIGQLMFLIDNQYAIPIKDYPSWAVLKDMELKMAPDGTVVSLSNTASHRRPIIKQIRPLLLTPAHDYSGISHLPQAVNSFVGQISNEQALLRWALVPEEIDQYVIERKLESEIDFVEYATVASGIGRFIDHSAVPEKTYQYRIVAENSFGHSSLSNVVTLTIPAVTFIRGDINRNKKVDISDPIYLLQYLYQPDTNVKPITCDDAADANDSGNISIADATHILQFLFLSNSIPLPPPYPEAGLDTTVDSLRCDL